MDPPASLKSPINLNFLVGWASQCGKLCKHGGDGDFRYLAYCLWNDVIVYVKSDTYPLGSEYVPK